VATAYDTGEVDEPFGFEYPDKAVLPLHVSSSITSKAGQWLPRCYIEVQLEVVGSRSRQSWVVG